MWAGERTARQHYHDNITLPQRPSIPLVDELISKRLGPVKVVCERHHGLADYCAAALKAKAPVDLEQLLRPQLQSYTTGRLEHYEK
jgi:hypothetical protein